MTFTEVEVDLMKAQGQVHQSKIVENGQNGGLPVWSSISIQETYLFVMKRHMSLSIYVHVGQS